MQLLPHTASDMHELAHVRAPEVPLDHGGIDIAVQLRCMCLGVLLLGIDGICDIPFFHVYGVNIWGASAGAHPRPPCRSAGILSAELLRDPKLMVFCKTPDAIMSDPSLSYASGKRAFVEADGEVVVAG